MNIQKLALFTLAASMSCGIMASEQERFSSPQRELPSALDHKKFNADKIRLTAALEDLRLQFVGEYNGSLRPWWSSNSSYRVGKIFAEIEEYWKIRADRPPLGYSFKSYMERCSLSVKWACEWYEEEAEKCR